MKALGAIITLRGGMDVLKNGQGIRIENEPHRPLVIQPAGVGPHGRTQISVAHTFVQNEQTVSDPEVVFEIIEDAQRGLLFSAVSGRQHDSVQIAVWNDEHARLRTDSRAIQALNTLARQWDSDLVTQGFLIAARRA